MLDQQDDRQNKDASASGTVNSSDTIHKHLQATGSHPHRPVWIINAPVTEFALPGPPTHAQSMQNGTTWTEGRFDPLHPDRYDGASRIAANLAATTHVGEDFADTTDGPVLQVPAKIQVQVHHGKAALHIPLDAIDLGGNNKSGMEGGMLHMHTKTMGSATEPTATLTTTRKALHLRLRTGE
jgi:hypothetical protein